MKTIVITGGNSGLGFETAKLLAQDKNNRLILGCRDQAKAQDAVDTIKKLSGNPNVQTVVLDLASFTSIRRFTEAVAKLTKTINVLACNAGIQIGSGSQVTAEGFEKTFGTNHLGHFLLTNRLFPLINQTSGRIVLVSSGTHFKPAIWQGSIFGIPPAYYTSWQAVSKPDNFPGYPEKSRGYVRYSASKLCVLYFGYELNARLRKQNSGIMVNLYDPGLMPGTELARAGKAIEIWAWKNIMPVLRLFDGVFSVQTSAKNLGKLLVDPAFKTVTGNYYEGPKQKDSSADSYNKAGWNDLWTGSEQLTGEVFDTNRTTKAYVN